MRGTKGATVASGVCKATISCVLPFSLDDGAFAKMSGEFMITPPKVHFTFSAYEDRLHVAGFDSEPTTHNQILLNRSGQATEVLFLSRSMKPDEMDRRRANPLVFRYSGGETTELTVAIKRAQ